jgi:hypothetical protein
MGDLRQLREQLPINFNRLEAIGANGILAEEDIELLNAATVKILKLMRDGAWHSAEEIIQVSGQREGLRRMRTLRRWYGIDRKRSGLTRTFYYRLKYQPSQS